MEAGRDSRAAAAEATGGHDGLTSSDKSNDSLQRFALTLRRMLNTSLQPALTENQSNDCTQDVLELPSMEEQHLAELFKDENIDALSECLNGGEVGDFVLVAPYRRLVKLCVEKALNASRCKLYKTISQVAESPNKKPVPTLLFRFQYLPPGYLRVCVMKASNLNVLKKGKMDTFVCVSLMPGDIQTVKSSVKNSSDPEYGFPAYFTGMSIRETSECCLQIQVREKRRFRTAKVIGTVFVMLRDFYLTTDNVLELPFLDW